MKISLGNAGSSTLCSVWETTLELGLSSSGNSGSLGIGSVGISSEVGGNHGVVLSHESLLLSNGSSHGLERVSLLLVGPGWGSLLWALRSSSWLLTDLNESWSSGPLLNSWVWVLWVVT